jgi:hypothetical protein
MVVRRHRETVHVPLEPSNGCLPAELQGVTQVNDAATFSVPAAPVKRG